MKLILHIGTEKTGSTSLQQWMHANDAQLVADGVWYARCLRRPDNRWIAVYGRDADEPDDGFDEAGIKTPEDHAQFSRRIERDLTAEVGQARAAGCRVFVISSEHMHSRLVHDRCVQRLHDLLVPLFEEIEVVCYLRPQAEVLQSRLSVSIRNGSLGQKDLLQIEEDVYYNYLGLWKRWHSAFKNTSLMPWRRNKDIVLEMTGRLSIEMGAYTPPLRENKRLDYRTAMLSVAYARSGYRIDPAVLNDELFIDYQPNREAIKISRRLAEKARNLYDSSNLELCKVVAGIDPSDLLDELDKFPIEDHLERVLEAWEASEQLGYVISRLHFQLEVEKCQAAIAVSERDIERKSAQSASESLMEARIHFEKANAISHRFSDVPLAEIQIRILEVGEILEKLQGAEQ